MTDRPWWRRAHPLAWLLGFTIGLSIIRAEFPSSLFRSRPPQQPNWPMIVLTALLVSAVVVRAVESLRTQWLIGSGLQLRWSRLSFFVGILTLVGLIYVNLRSSEVEFSSAGFEWFRLSTHGWPWRAWTMLTPTVVMTDSGQVYPPEDTMPNFYFEVWPLVCNAFTAMTITAWAMLICEFMTRRMRSKPER